MFEKVKKLFGAGPDALLKPLHQQADKIEALEPQFEKMTDEALAAKTIEFRARYKGGATLDDLLPEAFAAVREAAKRTLGLRPFRVS